MTTTVTTNLMPMNVTASFEASDNSAGDSFWRGNGGRSEEKKTKKGRKKGFFEGSVPAETWGIYADLAGLMNAICLLQTQSAFLNQAKSAVERLQQLSNQPKTAGRKTDVAATTAKLTAFIADILHKIQHKTELNADQTATNTLAYDESKRLQLKTLNHLTNCSDFADLIQKRMKMLENKKEHLQGLAQCARLRIEESNHPGMNVALQNLSDATNRTLDEFNSQSFKVFQCQTIRLPKKVLNLINN